MSELASRESDAPAPGRHTVLWDGECGFCGRVAAWIEHMDRRKVFEFVPYREYPGLTPELEAACDQAIQVLRADGSSLSAGRATLFIFSELGWKRTCAILSLPPLLWGVEVAYRILASNRLFFSRFLFRKPS